MSETGRIRRVWIAAEGRELKMMEGRHGVAARVRNVAIARFNERAVGCRSGETLAEERKEATETEQRRWRLGAAAKLAAEKKSRLRVP